MQSDPTAGGAAEIIQQPTNKNALTGESVAFEVSATGASPVSFQWLKNGNPLEGATNAILVLVNLQATDAGTYSVIVSNSFGSILSQAVMLTVQVLAPPGLAIRSYAGLSVTGIVGRAYALEYTTNLQATNDWHTATNIVLTVSPQVWIDFDSVNSPRRFYRAVLVP